MLVGGGRSQGHAHRGPPLAPASLGGAASALVRVDLLIYGEDLLAGLGGDLLAARGLLLVGGVREVGGALAIPLTLLSLLGLLAGVCLPAPLGLFHLLALTLLAALEVLGALL